MEEIQIGQKKIGADNGCYIIAELSGNHLHDFELAKKTIKAAKDAGVDAIKLQTYTPDTITLDVDNKYFRISQGTIWDGRTLYNLYKEAHTPWDWQPKLKEYADSLEIDLFSSPFDYTAVDFLEKMQVPCYKIASFEITDIPLIEYVAKKGKPVIMSTGIATEEDIKLAVDTCRKAGNDQIILLKCTSAYPTPLEDLNLKTIPDLQERFGCHVGLSDHTLGPQVPIAAVALGAKVIEKHIIVDRSMGGPDAKFSLEPQEFKQLVDDVRKTEKAMGTVSYELTEKMRKSREHSRSLFVAEDIKKGDVFTSKNIKSVRPGFGLHTKHYSSILSKRAQRDLVNGDPLRKEDIEGFDDGHK